MRLGGVERREEQHLAERLTPSGSERPELSIGLLLSNGAGGRSFQCHLVPRTVAHRPGAEPALPARWSGLSVANRNHKPFGKIFAANDWATILPS
jgi:hypothetical protein